MPLCEDCNTWDLETTNGFGVTLGKYDNLLVKAAEGCEGCKFFCAVLHSSYRWRTRRDELSGREISFSHLRLDAREEGIIGMTMSADDCCLDMCVASDYQAPLPKRVIEISHDPTVDPKIVSTEKQNGPYIILSHQCSGEVKDLALQEPEESRLSVPLDVTACSKAVSDAIDIARRLGYQYLWTRELCITAPELSDPSGFLNIYGQASLMLVASAGEEANRGLFHDRNVLYSPAMGPHKDRCFRPRELRWLSSIAESPLAMHGWNILERILAPRIVHFTKQQLIWECASGYQFEAAKLVGDQDLGPKDNAFDKSDMQRYVQRTLQQLPVETEIGRDEASKESVARLKTWTQNVNALSWGKFEDPSDKLPVIGRIALVMNDGTLGDYLAGIWSNHVVSGLSWGRMFSLLTPTPEYRAPTWSWASVDGPVTIDNVQADDTPVSLWAQTYQPELVSHHIELADPSNLYGRILEGSHIILEAACIGFKKLTDSLKSLEGQPKGFQVRPVLDQSLMFDCGCCRPRSAEDQEADTAQFTRLIEHHVCIVLKFDGWTTESDEGYCLLLILKGSGDEISFTRVGYLTVSFSRWNKPADPRGTFGALGWERRKLKLV
ncbi:hypothetical protein N7526_007613 [Penicillium atrosanguineum]|nr:hypothetical protein N7526_007613 [Penicillium atrosanguineum]